MSVTDTNALKVALRKDAFAARKAAKSDANSALACAHLCAFVDGLDSPRVIAGYMAIQTEVDPARALHDLHAKGHRVCLPVIPGHAKPLLFREWTPDSAMIEGDFGALIPRGGDLLVPDLAIVPLVAFDAAGHRLGYGGGFYDRTLEMLRQNNPDMRAVGFAFSAQEVDRIPVDANDQPLDAIITETGLRSF